MTRVLVVDDEAPIRELIVQVIALECDYTFDQAGDGTEAIDLMRKNAYDLVIVDRIMPTGLSGLDMIRKVRADPAIADVKILICSASNLPDDIDEAINSGADEYVVKPLDFSEIVVVVKRVIASPRKPKSA